MARSLIFSLVILAALDLCFTYCRDDYFIILANNTLTDDSNEVEEMVKMYQKTKEEMKILAKLKDNLGRRLSTRYADLVANTVCTADDSSPEMKWKIQSQIKQMFEIFDQQLAEDILEHVMSEAGVCDSPSQLNYLLWGIYRECDIKTFELMLQTQLKVFNKATEDVIENDVVMKFAYYLYKLRDLKEYQRLRPSLKQKIDIFMRKVPESLQNILYASNFCLMNAKYNEYIYTAIGDKTPQTTDRSVWVWHDKWKIDDTGHIAAKLYESDNDQTTELLVQLKGVKYDAFYYMKPETNFVSAWDPPSEPPNSIWSIEFLKDDRVVLSQGEYIMCSTEEKLNAPRRLVRGYKHGVYTSESSECQWHLGRCDRT